MFALFFFLVVWIVLNSLSPHTFRHMVRNVNDATIIIRQVHSPFTNTNSIPKRAITPTPLTVPPQHGTYANCVWIPVSSSSRKKLPIWHNYHEMWTLWPFRFPVLSPSRIANASDNIAEVIFLWKTHTKWYVPTHQIASLSSGATKSIRSVNTQILRCNAISRRALFLLDVVGLAHRQIDADWIYGGASQTYVSLRTTRVDTQKHWNCFSSISLFVDGKINCSRICNVARGWSY